MIKPDPTRLTDLSLGRKDQPDIDPRIIKVEAGHNPRDYTLPENRAHLDELKESIRENGVLVPLIVRWEPGNKQVIIVDGECRLRCCLELISEGVEIISVPCQQVKAGNEAERLVTAITANTGKPFAKWEIGGAFKRLLGFGLSAEMVAKKTGYKLIFINQALELSDAPQDVKHLLSIEAITPSLAISHLKEHGDNAGKTLKKAVKKAKEAALPGEVVVAKRAKAKSTMVKFTPEVWAAIKAALDDAATSQDATTAGLAQAALDLIGK